MRILPFIILLLIFSSTSLHSQDVRRSASRINQQDELTEWVAQYPDLEASKKKGFLRKVEDLVLGKKPDFIVKPVGVCVDSEDKVWILSQETGLVLKIINNEIHSGLGKSFKKNIYYPSLVSLCKLPGKGVLFTDSYLNLLMLIDEDQGSSRIFNEQVALEQPTGVAYSKPTDQVWVIETRAHKISVFSSGGDYLKSIGGRGTEPGQFNFPTHLWIDHDGRAYVVDAMNFRVQIFSKEGEFISAFGKAGDATGSMARPKGIACDSKGNIYVADALFNTVQVFNDQGDFLYYFGSQGADKGQFWMPAGLFIDQKDRIYVSDSFNNRVQVFKLKEGG